MTTSNTEPLHIWHVFIASTYRTSLPAVVLFCKRDALGVVGADRIGRDVDEEAASIQVPGPLYCRDHSRAQSIIFLKHPSDDTVS